MPAWFWLVGGAGLAYWLFGTKAPSASAPPAPAPNPYAGPSGYSPGSLQAGQPSPYYDPSTGTWNFPNVPGQGSGQTPLGPSSTVQQTPPDPNSLWGPLGVPGSSPPNPNSPLGPLGQ